MPIKKKRVKRKEMVFVQWKQYFIPQLGPPLLNVGAI